MLFHALNVFYAFLNKIVLYKVMLLAQNRFIFTCKRYNDSVQWCDFIINMVSSTGWVHWSTDV